MMTTRLMALSGVTVCLTAVGIGAFGAHAFEEILRLNQRTDVYDLANRYQFYHGFALLILAAFADRYGLGRLVQWSAVLFVLGIIVFCGSLYALALTNKAVLGAITPIGGVFLILAWVLFLLVCLQYKQQ